MVTINAQPSVGTGTNSDPRSDAVTFEEYHACMAIIHEWARCYDMKDWAALPAILAPHIHVDYRSFLNREWPAMPAAEFLAMASDENVLGDPLLHTQHFVGASHFVKTSPLTVTGYHQLRVPHQRYAHAASKEVIMKGHAHSYNTHWYEKVDGVWKFAGLKVELVFGEYDFEHIFEKGREKHGTARSEKEKGKVIKQVQGKPPSDEHLSEAVKGLFSSFLSD